MKKRHLIENIRVKKLTMYNIFDKIYYNNKEDFYMLKRKIEKKLYEWKSNKNKKCLVIKN